MVDLGVYGRTNTLNDYLRAEEEFLAAKQAKEADAALKKQEFLWKLQNGGAETPADWQTAQLYMKAYNEAYPDNPINAADAFGITKRNNPYNLSQNLVYNPETNTVSPRVGAPQAVEQMARAGEYGTQSVQVPASATKTINDQRAKAGMPPIAMMGGLDPMEASRAAVRQQRATLGTTDKAPDRERIFLPDTLPPLDQQDMGMPVIPTDASLAAAKSAAESVAKVQGDTSAELGDRLATFPQLIQTAQKLSSLGKTATYTRTGQIADAINNEWAGLTHLSKPSQGSIDRSEYMSTVNNQILPLLRQTFGAQFTEKEGQTLRDTLGATNATPEQKDAVLRGFIWQKALTINSKERQLGLPETQFPSMDEVFGGQPPTPQGAGGGASLQPAATFRNIPMDAVNELKADPSPQAQMEFDAIFGKGASKMVVGNGK